MWLGRGCPQIEWYPPRVVRFRVTFVGMGKRWGRRGVAAAVVGLVGVVGISACGGGGDESSDSSESTEGDGGSESESATESTSAESPSGSAETPSGEESPSGGEVSTADVEFTEWELERRATPPPERPAEMDDPGEAGAIATAEYFVALLAFAEETGVVDGLEEISSPECEYCQNYLNSAREGVLGGGPTRQTQVWLFWDASRLVLETTGVAPLLLMHSTPSVRLSTRRESGLTIVTDICSQSTSCSLGWTSHGP
ncbi:MAG: DUF6318 family protein [Actinomycetaceae bacterium]